MKIELYKEPETVKFCRCVNSNKWYVFGFVFTDHKRFTKYKVILCYDEFTVFKRRNDMYVVESTQSIKDMLLTNNESDKIVAISLLNAQVKQGNCSLLKYK